MQKMKSFAWILILLFAANFLLSFAHEASDHKVFLISSKELSFSDLEEHNSDTRKLMASGNITLTEKAQKGKGSYGGANLVHRKPTEKNAALSYMPCLLIPSIILGFSFFLLLAFPFPLI